MSKLKPTFANNEEHYYDAVRRGVQDAFWQMVTSSTQMPGHDFFDAVGDAVERATTKSILEGLKGKYILTFGADKELQYQGLILEESRDACLVQMFGWFDGGPTSVMRFTKEFIFSDSCKLYADRETFLQQERIEEKRAANLKGGKDRKAVE